jgi:hypothetical protein
MIRLLATLSVLGACSAPPATGSSDSAAADTAVPEAQRGPFGIAGGMALDDLSVEQLQPGLYLVTDVPNPHVDFEEVYVTAWPSTGVCSVRANSPVQSSDSTGARTREIVMRVATQLQTRYGEPEITDRCVGYLCRQGYSNPSMWAYEILQGERGYMYEFNPDGPVDHVTAVHLGAMVTNYAQPFARLEYTFDNAEACESAEAASGAESL